MGLTGRQEPSPEREGEAKRTLHLGPHLILFHPHPEVVRQLVGEDGQQEDLGDGAAEGLVEGLVLLFWREGGRVLASLT